MVRSRIKCVTFINRKVTGKGMQASTIVVEEEGASCIGRRSNERC